MTVRALEVVHAWLGWCPNAPAVYRTQPVISVFPDTELVQPGGGTGGTGGIGRGIRFTLESVKVLNRNRSLRWFALLAGLVAGIVFCTQYGVGLLATYPYDAVDFPRWLALTFSIALFATFCVNFLMAALILCLSPGTVRPVSFWEGLSRGKKHLRPLAGWSVILALWDTALFAIFPCIGFSRFSLSPVAGLFPFRFILLPEVYHIGPMGGTYAMLYAFASTVAMAAVVLLLTVLTLFVVPLLVLENRSLPGAVAGSFRLMKNVISETLTVFLAIGTVLYATSLLSLLFGAVYGICAPEMQLFWYPGDGWIAAAGLFMLGLCALAFIGATVAGIAMLYLYQCAKTGRVSIVPEGGQGAVPV